MIAISIFSSAALIIVLESAILYLIFKVIQMSGFNQKNDVSKGRLFFVYLQQFRCFLV